MLAIKNLPRTYTLEKDGSDEELEDGDSKELDEEETKDEDEDEDEGGAVEE